MSHYQPKKIRPWRIVAMVLRGTGRALNAWPLLLIAAVMISPVGPHMRWQYQYQDVGYGHRIYYACQYIGARGFVRHMEGADCPFFTIIDRRDGL